MLKSFALAAPTNQLRASGAVTGKLKGQVPTQTKPYTYDMSFSLPIAK